MRSVLVLALVITAMAAPVSAFNFLVNPNFSDGITGWDVSGPWVHNPAAGAFGQLGAAEVTSTGAGVNPLSQCVDVSMVAGGRTVTVVGFANDVNHASPYELEIGLYDSTDCSGSPVVTAAQNAATPPTGVFNGLYVPIVVPLAGAQRALVRFAVTNGAASETTQFDIASLRYDLIVGGNFNTDLNSWVQTPPGSWQLVADGLTIPAGAAEATVAADGSVFLSQCLQLGDVPPTPFFSGWIRVKALDELADYQLSFQFWDNGICAPPGNLLSAQGLLTRPGSLNEWGFFFTTVLRPIGAQSVAVFIALNPGGGTPGTQFRVDDFIMTVSDISFDDGFETGDLSAWSTSSP